MSDTAFTANTHPSHSSYPKSKIKVLLLENINKAGVALHNFHREIQDPVQGLMKPICACNAADGLVQRRLGLPDGVMLLLQSVIFIALLVSQALHGSRVGMRLLNWLNGKRA